MTPSKKTLRVQQFLLLIGMICIANAPLNAQHGIVPLLSQGPVPEQITQLAMEKLMEMDLRGRSRVERKAIENYEMGSTYFLDHVLKTRGIVFGTPHNHYLDSVAALLLAGYPEMAENVHIYILRSAEVNAYVLKGGVILVTAGLLAYLQSEAELAFVLAHEMAHWKEDHGLNIHLEISKRVVEAHRSSSFDFHQLLTDYFAYSQSQELEADSLAVARFYAAHGYQSDAVTDLLKKFYSSEDPFDNIHFDPDFFYPGIFPPDDESIHRPFIPMVERKEREDDMYTTHPGISERVNRLNAWFYPTDSLESEEMSNRFIVSESSFLAMRDAMRRELGLLYLQQEMLEMAMYQSWLMTSLDTAYCERSHYVMAYALYHQAMSIGQQRQQRGVTTRLEEHTHNGEILRLIACNYHLRDNPLLLTSVALYQFTRLYHQTNRHHAYKPFIDDLVMLLNYQESIDLNNIAKNASEKTLNEVIEKIHNDSLLQPLLSLVTQPDYLELFVREEEPSLQPKLLVLQPRFGYSVNRVERLVASERKKYAFVHDMQLSMERLQIDHELLDAGIFDEGDVDLFNRMITANEWLVEYWTHTRNRQHQFAIRPSGEAAFRNQFGDSYKYRIMIPFVASNWDIQYSPLRALGRTLRYLVIFPITPHAVINRYTGHDSYTRTGLIVVDVNSVTTRDNQSTAVGSRYRFDHVSGRFYQHLHRIKNEK